MLPGIVVFLSTMFQRDLRSITSSDLRERTFIIKIKILRLSLQEPRYAWVPAGVVFEARFQRNCRNIKNCLGL